MRLNVGCGENIEEGWTNIDLHSDKPNVQIVDVDDGLPYPDNEFEEVRSWGNLNEFESDVVTIMSEFWRVLCDGGLLDIRVAVVDNGNGAFRDPLARRYLNSQWVQYFFRGGQWENSGRGFGFKGCFDLVSTEVAGETHHVVLRAVK